MAQAPKLQTAFLSALQTNHHVLVDLSDATGADLSFIQLLISAKRTASALGKLFTISAPEEGVVMQKINCVGNPSGKTPNFGAH